MANPLHCSRLGALGTGYRGPHPQIGAAVRATVLATITAFLLAACSSGDTAKPEAPTGTQFAPVTSAPLRTTTTSSSTTLRSSSTSDPAQEEADGLTSDDSGATSESETTESDDQADAGESDDNQRPGNAGDQVTAGPINPIADLARLMSDSLGPSADVAATLDSLAVFPYRPATPNQASIIELQIGIGGGILPRTSPSPEEVVVSVSATMTTSASPSAALATIGGSLTRSGLRLTDTNQTESGESRSYRISGAGRFDEIVVTIGPNTEAETRVMLTYNGTTTRSRVARFQSWSGTEMPLPRGDESRTLVAVFSAGQDRLTATTFRAETGAIIDGGSSQREANRLHGKLDSATQTEEDPDNPQFRLPPSGTDFPDGSDKGDAPLVQTLRHRYLDSAGYEIVGTQRVTVDSDGELELVDAVEVRITGELEMSTE